MSHWEVVKHIEGGAQGICSIVKRKDGHEKVYFMKRLKDDGNTERRRRFFLETTIFKSFHIKGLPAIIETNSDEFENKEIPLYYVAEYIEGTRLDKYVKSKKISESEIVSIFSQLLIILKSCHEKDVVHRDVKPENIIILKSGELSLVDFGISYSEVELQLHLTPVGQELGNRFLRLPEFSAGSSNKRDVRSDITLACGIALYMISKDYPRTLLDHEGRFPHQTRQSSEAIKALPSTSIWNMIFDKAFENNMARRWNNADQVLNFLSIMKQENIDKTKEYEQILQQHVVSIQFDNMIELEKALHLVYDQVHQIIYHILAAKAPGFRTEEQGWVYQKGDFERKCQVRAYPLGKKRFLDIHIIAQMSGEQIIGFIVLNDKEESEVCRVTFGESLNENELVALENDIQRLLLQKLVDTINNS